MSLNLILHGTGNDITCLILTRYDAKTLDQIARHSPIYYRKNKICSGVTVLSNFVQCNVKSDKYT